MSSTPTISGTINASAGNPVSTTGPSVSERLAAPVEQWLRLAEMISRKIRVSLPGIIQSFDPVKQTVSVLPAIREYAQGNNIALPRLDDVPISLPHCASGILTMPIQAGDECLLVFSDLCLDAWWQNGGVQNRMLPWRHQIGDAIAIIGTWSQPNKLQNWSTDSIQLRNIAGTSYLELAGDTINLVAGDNTISVGPGGITINGTALSLSADGATQIENRTFLTHQHQNVQSGSSDSGPVV